jgi:hypothetical protein
MSINATLVIDERRAWSPARDETSVLSGADFARGLFDECGRCAADSRDGVTAR